jgi:hypothetical protein
MDIEILHKINPDDIQQLKYQGIMKPTGDNQLFDIIADRAVEYRLNIPRSKFNNSIVKVMSFKQYFEKKFNDNNVDGRSCWRDTVLVLEYDKTKCKNPNYVGGYLLKQIQ